MKISIPLKKLIDDLKLETVAGEKGIDNIFIVNSEINRPGLQFVGYHEFFGEDRIQIAGMGEMAYLESITPNERREHLDAFFKLGFPAIVVCRNIPVTEEMIGASNKYNIPLLRTDIETTKLMNGMISYLMEELAPRVIIHADLIEVYGEGILIKGESGIGKSEIALELVKRGHRLVADDSVEIRKTGDKMLVGQAPEIIRYHLEVRGIGIMDIKNMYGVGSVKMSERIDLVLNFEQWDDNKTYERLGLSEEYTDILGVKVPSHTIPVSPGRNLAVIVEAAAINNRQKAMGYNAALNLVAEAEKKNVKRGR